LYSGFKVRAVASRPAAHAQTDTRTGKNGWEVVSKEIVVQIEHPLLTLLYSVKRTLLLVASTNAVVDTV